MLETEHIRLRAPEPEDLDILYSWENDTELWHYGSTVAPYSRLTLRQYLIDMQQQDFYQMRQLRFMIESKPQRLVVGNIDLYDYDPHNDRAAVGILIDEAYRKHSFGFQAIELVKEYAFNFLDIHQLFAYVSVDNEKSLCLFRKAGFDISGTLKQWRKQNKSYKDVYLMQLISDGQHE